MKPNQLKFLFLILIGFLFSCRKYDLRKEHGEINRLNENIIQFSPLLNANGSVQISGYTRSPKQHSLYAVLLDSSQYVSSHYDVTGNLYFSPIANLTGRFENEISQPVSGIKDNVEYVAYIVDSESPNPSTTALYQTKSNPFRFAKVGNRLVTSVKSTNIDTNSIHFNTKEASNLTKSTATLNGEIKKINPSTKVIEYGFYWKKADNSSPYFALALKNDTAKPGIFSTDLAALTPGTMYVYRAFAKTNMGEYVGELKSFTTPTKDLATVKTLAVDSSTITYSGAKVGGVRLTVGDESTKSYGFVYAKVTNPTLENAPKQASSNLNNNAFDAILPNLTSGTKYYVRAYVTSDAGTAYGNEVYFTTTLSTALPTVTTIAITNITATTAQSGVVINSAGGSSVQSSGICYSTSPIPTIADPKSYTSLYSLIPNTIYYVRAFATNSAGTAYGNELSFKTLAALPTVVTTDVSAITTNTAVSGGKITNDGGAAITEKGVCWGTSTNPTIANSKTTNGTDTASFVSNLSALNAGTTYYLRAYATNSMGTAYGNQISFKTPAATLPSIATVAISNITNTTASSGGSISSDGGAAITAKGVCWSTSTSPTISNSKTNDGTGTANFTSAITGLAAGTTYYVRAYATTSVGTVYGNVLSFIYNNTGSTMTDIEGNTYPVVTIGTQIWMGENLRVTKYKDGTIIPLVTSNAVWAANYSNVSKLPMMAWYNNDKATHTANKNGALYNWYVVNTGKLCPTGWHVPTDVEWTTLTTYLGGQAGAGLKLKATSGWNSGENGTNDVKFTALPGGLRYDYNGTFIQLGSFGVWWSTSASDAFYASGWVMVGFNNNVQRTNYSQVNGLSVRCLRD